jgi:hypothetical protein
LGELEFGFFEVMGGYPRGATEEGGHLVLLFVCLREFLMFWGTLLWCDWNDLRGGEGFTKVKDEGLLLEQP